MIRKLLLTLALALVGAGISHAQTFVPVVAGVANINAQVDSSFKVFLNANATVSITNPQPGKVITITFQENATGGFTVSYPSYMINGPTVATAANAITASEFTYDSGSNTWQSIAGGSSSGGAAGSLTDATIYVNSTCGTGATNCFAATPGQAFLDCTYASGSPAVTCSANDTLTTAMIGWRIMLTCCGAQGGTNHVGSALQTPAGTTISNINNSTHVITMSANATATQATPNVGEAVVMGPPPGSATGADTAFAAASTAALGSGGHCAPMNIGAGLYLVSQGFANSAICKNGITSGLTTGWGVTGAGTSGRSGTTIVPVDNFNFATCTGQNSSCFFGVPGAIISNLAIWGGDNSTSVNSSTCGTNNKKILDLVTDTLAYNVLLAGWCANDTALIGIKMDTPGEYCFYCIVDGAGSLAFDVASTSNSYISHSFGGDAVGQTIGAVTACGLIVENGGTLQSLANGFGACGSGAMYDVGVAGTLWEDLDRYLDSASFNNPYANIVGTGIVHSTGLTAFSFVPGNTLDITYTLSVAGAQLFVRDSLIPGGSAFSSIGCQVAAVTVYDQGGNTLSNPNTNCNVSQYIADGHSVIGACTGVGTAASTIGLRISGSSTTGTAVVTACTNSAVLDAGVPMSGAKTLRSLSATASAAGTNASSGVVTVLKNGVASALTCTIGTGTSCLDNTHTVAVVAGDLVSLQFTTQAADTLAGVKSQVVW